MTAAEAQSFKRASSCFGLGRYLYNLPETWVPLDGQGKPIRLPALPNWALPKANPATGKTNPACGPRPPVVQRGPIDQKTTARIEGFRRTLGDPIYGEILWRVARARQANAIPNAQLQATLPRRWSVLLAESAKCARWPSRSVIRSSSPCSIGLHIGSMTTIRNLEALRHLVLELEGLARQPAA